MERFLKFKILMIMLGIVNSLEPNNFQAFCSCVLGRGTEPGRIVVRSESEAYNTLNFHWQLRLPGISPLAYVVAKNEDDVVTSVVCGTKYEVRVVGRSGGHSFEKYSFGDNSSVVLDLGNINSIFLDKSSSVATIGPGALVGPISMTLWNSGKTFFPVSSCPTVGISGLATGGGYGFLSRAYGLTTDYIMSMRVVTADGHCLEVNSVNYTDLYWALRGGGGASFGIVTLFVMKVVPAPPQVFTATVSWNLEQFVTVFKAWQEFTLVGPRNVTAKMNINSGKIEVFFTDLNEGGATFNKVMKNFPVPNSTTRKFLKYPDFLVSTAGPLKLTANKFTEPDDLLNLKRTSIEPEYQMERSFYVQKIASTKGLSTLQSFLNNAPASVTVSFQAYGGAINDVKNSDTAFVHRSGRLALAIISNQASNNSDSPASKYLDNYFELGKSIFNQRESYQNYVDGKLSDYLQRYYKTNLGRLIQVKQKYDPNNYFHNPQSVPVKPIPPY